MVKLLWHEQSNCMAAAEINGSLPLLTIFDDEFHGINPFYSYPLAHLLDYYGWVDIGGLW